MSDIYYGKIKQDKLVTWETNNNPYDILEKNIRISRLGGWDFLTKAKYIFTEERQLPIKD